MGIKFGDRLKNLSLILKFNLISLAILLVGCAAIGWWISDQIETRVLMRVGHATSMFTGSVFAPLVGNLLPEHSEPEEGAIDEVLDLAGLGEEIVAFKIWDREGRVIHSSNAAEIGLSFEVDAGLQSAWDGVVSAAISRLDRPEHAEQRAIADRLLEIYTPVRHPGTGTILAVLEYYQSVTELEKEIRNARAQSWVIVAALLTVVYLSLVLLVSGGSRTIVRQRDELARQVRDYQRIVARNVELDNRLRAAAAETTTLNERYLRRIAADLHDGPAQHIAYALLKPDDSSDGEREDSKKTLKRALDDIRNISAGLRSPDLETLSLGRTIQRAVGTHEKRSGQSVSLTCSDLPDAISLAVKITAFRVIQESLTNAARHSRDDSPTVSATEQNGWIELKIEDQGPGFIHSDAKTSIHLGISFMRERVELLGGTFTISSSPYGGTYVEARIPTDPRGGPSDV